MDLFLLRHAEASFQQGPDEERQLTARGRRELLHIISANAHHLVGIEHIWVSPYVRAQQTLALIRPYLPDAAAVVDTDLLTPDQDPLAILPLLRAVNTPSCLLVAHQPLLGRLLDKLCNLAPGEQSLGTSALAAISLVDFAPGLGQLRWLRQP